MYWQKSHYHKQQMLIFTQHLVSFVTVLYFFLLLHCRDSCKYGKHIQQNRYYSIVILTFLDTISIDISLRLDTFTYIPFLIDYNIFAKT